MRGDAGPDKNRWYPQPGSVSWIRRNGYVAPASNKPIDPNKPIDKGLPSPGLLSAIVVGKSADHLRLHRLEDVFAPPDVNQLHSTLCRWVLQTADILEPLYLLMIERVCSLFVIHSGDTPVPVLELTLPKTRTAHF